MKFKGSPNPDKKTKGCIMIDVPILVQINETVLGKF